MDDTSVSRQNAGSPDLKKGFRRHMGVSDTIQFLACIGGRTTRWPVLVAMSLFTVCLIAFFISHFMLETSQSLPPREGPSGSVPATEGASPAHGLATDALGQGDEHAARRNMAFSLRLQSEAEAAVQQKSARGLGGRGGAIQAGAGDASIRQQVLDLLAAARKATESENLESLLSLMDESESDFFRQQKLKAKMAFRQFDGIQGKYSDVKIKPLNDNELAISLRCKVDAAYTKSGRRIVLFDGDQNMTLRKTSSADWKICAID